MEHTLKYDNDSDDKRMCATGTLSREVLLEHLPEEMGYFECENCNMSVPVKKINQLSILKKYCVPYYITCPTIKLTDVISAR